LLLRDKGRSFRSKKNGELTFTSRDKLVLSHLAQGLTNDEIAQLLGVNTRTIKHYLTKVFRKMQVRNRVEAVLCAKAMRICD
jgi:DNA-binding NarL/FixJ family response regulator